MKFSFIEVILIILILLLSFVAYQQSNRIDSLYDTLDLQHEAILKQNLLINMQADHIDSIKPYNNHSVHPNFL